MAFQATFCRRLAFLAILMLHTSVQNILGFQILLPIQQANTRNINLQLSKKSGEGFGGTTSGGGGGGGSSQQQKSKPAASPAGDFAFQEMLVFFNSMQKQGASSRNMDAAKREELAEYVRTVLSNKRDRSIPVSQIGQALLPLSQWKLMFSTSEAVLESLPQDATVFLNILDEENLDYTLKFSQKTMGLESLTAKCKYTFDAGPVQPGLLTFVYDKITTNVLGFKNVGVGLFGMLKGRVNYVESAYFDGTFWIERGISPSGNGDFVSVYMRVDD